MDKKKKREKRGVQIFFIALLILAFGPSLVGMTRATLACQLWKNPQDTEARTSDKKILGITDAIEGYARLEDQTYLTLPEWYIVYSTDEYGAFIAENSPTQFPHFKAVGQYWQSYYDVCHEVRGRYPRNGGYQFVLGFIGVSFTAENMLKGAYETTIGRAAEWIGSGKPTEEEIYAAEVAQEYAAFLHNTQWYLFPFGEKFQGLWSETSLWGPDPIRKWERKLSLSVEYGLKSLYGGLTSAGSDVAYGGPDESKIYAITTGVTSEMLSGDLEIIEEVDEKRQLVHLTRFEVFSTLVPDLTQDGLTFVEIAGNDELLVTLLAPQNSEYDFKYGAYLFDLPILTQPKLTRAAIKVRVDELHLFLNELSKQKEFKFEHIYDY